MKKFFKILFSSLPYKKHLFCFIRRVWSPPLGVYQHLHFNGIFEVKVDAENFKIQHNGHTIENQLFWKGIDDCWEKNSLRIWKDLARNSNIIFDIGANTGVYTLIAKTVNKNCSVHAFEPFPAIWDTLKKNTALNQYDVECNCTAISNYKGKGVIFSDSPDFAYSVTVNKNLWTKEQQPFIIPINTTTLKDYIEEQKLDGIDLMKIDVETHEPEVIEGFAEYLLKFKPVILIEVLNDQISQKLNACFSSDHYDFYNIDEGRGIKKVSKLTKSEDFNFLIVPLEKSSLFNYRKYPSYS